MSLSTTGYDTTPRQCNATPYVRSFVCCTATLHLLLTNFMIQTLLVLRCMVLVTLTTGSVTLPYTQVYIFCRFNCLIVFYT